MGSASRKMRALTTGRLGRSALPGLLALIAAVAPAAAPAAPDACSEAAHVLPTGPAPTTPPPLAIGDSVMLGAVEPLRRRGFEVDARGCRQMREGLRLLGARARAGSLPKTVAIALGTNWTVTSGQIRRALRIMGRRRVLGLVTPREVGGAASADQEAIRAAGRRWPRRVKVVDWVVHSASHRGWFWSDGLHLTPKGARALARLMSAALIAPASGEEPQPAGAQRSRTAGPAMRPAFTR
jgi:hypothetical protein